MDEFVRSPNNYDMDAVSVETGLLCEDPSLAIQSAAEEADINTIVRRFGLTGQLPTDVRTPQFGDFTGVTDYQSALNAVRAAGENFMELPAQMRYRFANDPQRFLEFVENPDNQEEMIKMGLAKRVGVEPATVSPAASAATTGVDDGDRVGEGSTEVSAGVQRSRVDDGAKSVKRAVEKH